MTIMKVCLIKIPDSCFQETWLDRVMGHPAVEAFINRVDKITQSLTVAVLFDLMDVGLMYFTM